MSRKLAVACIAIVLGCAASGTTEDSWRERVDELFTHLPPPTRLRIEHRAILGLQDRSQWYIGDTLFGIRLHPEGRFDLEGLDTDKIYEVTGIVVEQNYGIVEVWVQDVRPIGVLDRP